MSELTPSQKLEQTIQAALDISEPSEQFFITLGDRLEAQAGLLSQESKRVKSKTRLFRQPAWRFALAFVLVAGLVILAIGPQQVLAQVQRLLGYVPGIGFIELGKPLILAQPVSLQQDGIMVQVSQVIANTEGTLIQYSISFSEGVTPEDLPVDQKLEYKPVLLLEDGREIDNLGESTGANGGSLQFPALPQGTRQMSLIFNCLPMFSMKGPGCLPGEWKFALALTQANADQFPGILTLPYVPQASATANGITMRVQQVAHNREITAVQLQFAWGNSTWSWMGGGGGPNPSALRDDSGYSYELKTAGPGKMTDLGFPIVTMIAPRSPEDTPTGQIMTQVETDTFAPLSSTARQLTFSIETIRFQVPAGGEFSLDLGNDPKIGQTWTLDQKLNIAGFEAHLIGARLNETMEPDGSGGQEPFYWLEFFLQADPQLDRRLDYFDAEQVNEEPAWTHRSTKAGGGSQGMVISFGTQYMPKGLQVYRISQAYILLHGPWQVSWEIPSSIMLPTNERRAQPQDAAQEQDGVFLKLEAAQANDQASQALVTAPDLPPGSELLYILGWNPLTQAEAARPELYLQDDHGQRYEATKSAYLPPTSEECYDPAGLTFAPVPAEASRLALHVPAVELKQSGQAAISVEVPSGLSFHEEVQTEMFEWPGEVVPMMVKRTVSEAWDTDIHLELAGYVVHFTRAYIQEGDILTPGAYQLVLTGTPLIESQGERWLREIQVSTIRRPDGTSWQAGEASWLPYYGFPSSVLIDRPKSGSTDLAAELRLNVTAANGVDLLPGKYEIELDSATVIVPGPWELSFLLPGK